MNGGLVGTLIGLTCATVAMLWNVWLRRRYDDPEPVASVLGLRAQGVERAIYGRGARVAFPLYVVIVEIYLLSRGDSTSAGVLGGCAGATYGACTAWVGARIGR